jgi:hypothetical protein
MRLVVKLDFACCGLFGKKGEGAKNEEAVAKNEMASATLTITLKKSSRSRILPLLTA